MSAATGSASASAGGSSAGRCVPSGAVSSARPIVWYAGSDGYADSMGCAGCDRQTGGDWDWDWDWAAGSEWEVDAVPPEVAVEAEECVECVCV